MAATSDQLKKMANKLRRHSIESTTAAGSGHPTTCMSAAVNTTLLWRGLAKRGVYKARPGWKALLARILFANAVMAALLIWMGGDLAGWLNLPPAQRAARLALCVVCGAAAYFAALFLSGTRLRHVRNIAGA